MGRLHSLTGCIGRNRRGTRGLLPAALVAVLLGAAPAPAQIVINATFDSSITSDPNAATIIGTINQAILNYSTRFADPITVSIQFQEMPSGLGASSVFENTLTYTQWRNALATDSKTVSDATVAARLPGGSNNPVNGDGSVFLTTPNLRALGFSGAFANPPAGQPDGVISLNTSITNLSRSGPQDPGKFDLLAVVEHEMDEVFGIVSALTGVNNGDPAPTGPVAALDVFRYDAAGNRSFTTAAGAQAFFSIDGTADLARFNQQQGADFNDWFSTGPHTPQVQDAFATAGAQPNLGVELTVLDVLGYDLVPVPEPSGLALLGAAALALAGRGRRRAKAAAGA
jgi:hypothetical protein